VAGRVIFRHGEEEALTLSAEQMKKSPVRSVFATFQVVSLRTLVGRGDTVALVGLHQAA
jgi:hypothetical protein